MSTKTDVMAIEVIGEEVVRLLSLPDDRLETEARDGLRYIAELAQWRDIAFGSEVTPPALVASAATPKIQPSAP